MSKFNTDREAFDAIAAHLSSMTSRCAIDNGRCLYTREDGNACAIGGVIDPELRTQLSGTMADIFCVATDYAEVYNATFGPEVSISMLAELQCVHDSVGMWGPRSINKDRLIGALKRIESQYVE
jgi:hypothetical protein